MQLRPAMNKKGQSVLSEYVMIFFVVIAALVAVTTFVQRGFEARIHDARDFMINAVANACDADCMKATGNAIAKEYEPYYAQMLSDVQQNADEKAGATKSGVNWSIGAIYTKTFSDTTKTISTGTQLPSECADGANPKPSYCANFNLK